MQKIYFPAATIDSLFDGADSIALAGIDVPASLDRYDDVLADMITESYPDARVDTGSPCAGTAYYVEGFGEEDTSVADHIGDLAMYLFRHGDLWLVDAS